MDRVAVRSASAGQCASVAFKTLSSPAQPMEGSSGGEGETSQSSSSSSSSSSDDDEDEDGDEDEEEAYGEEVGSSPSQRQTKEKERWLRRCYRGTVLVSPEACPAAVWEFEAEVRACRCLNGSGCLSGVSLLALATEDRQRSHYHHP